MQRASWCEGRAKNLKTKVPTDIMFKKPPADALRRYGLDGGFRRLEVYVGQRHLGEAH